MVAWETKKEGAVINKRRPDNFRFTHQNNPLFFLSKKLDPPTACLLLEPKIFWRWFLKFKATPQNAKSQK
jgi:hypothetical protein